MAFVDSLDVLEEVMTANTTREWQVLKDTLGEAQRDVEGHLNIEVHVSS